MGGRGPRWDAGAMLRLLPLPVLAAAVLALAGPAAANTYCVAAPGCSGTNVGGDVQAGLDAAGKHPGDDKVRIGPGTFKTMGLGFHYDDPAVGNHVAVVGAGPGKTTLGATAHDSATALSLQDGSSARDLHLTVPPGLFQHGLQLHAASAQNVRVDGGASVGAVLSGGSSLAGSEVFGEVAIDVFGGASTVYNTRAAGRAIGVRVFGETTFTRLQRMRLDAEDGGSQPAAVGLKVECGRVALDDSVVDVRGAVPTATGVDGTPGQCATGTINGIEVRQSTILGSGAGSNGVVASSTDPTLASAVDVTNSIVRGFQHGLYRVADGGIAFMETNASDYPTKGIVDQTVSGGTGTLSQTVHVDVAPMFVNPSQGDFRLAAGSPLIDAGSLDGLFPGESPTDRAGNPRIVDGNGDGTARRDIGAFEVQPGA
jgi:hypothetical protein